MILKILLIRWISTNHRFELLRDHIMPSMEETAIPGAEKNVHIITYHMSFINCPLCWHLLAKKEKHMHRQCIRRNVYKPHRKVAINDKNMCWYIPVCVMVLWFKWHGTWKGHFIESHVYHLCNRWLGVAIDYLCNHFIASKRQLLSYSHLWLQILVLAHQLT